jgi:hypothetical protein
VIWIWLLMRHAHSFATGPMDRYFTYFCEHCRAQTAAFVRTFGHGTGRDIWTAERNAHASADGYAYRLVAAAGCPCCSQLQPNALAMYEHAAKRARWRRVVGLPLALGLAAVMLILIGIPAVHDRHDSLLLFAVAASVATAVFGLVLGIVWARVPVPLDNPVGVWFSRDPSQGPQSWFPARPGPSPMVVQPNGFVRVLALAAMGASAISALVALVLWEDTFRKLYVINTTGKGDQIVRIDGREVGRVSSNSSGDAPNARFEVRTSSPHELVIVDPGGAESRYHLDPDGASHGWVIAPHARSRDLCITAVTWYYGSQPKDNADDKVLNDKRPGEIVELQKSYDYVFTPPPASIQTQSSSETRSTLRAFDCDELDRDKMVPWSSVSR